MNGLRWLVDEDLDNDILRGIRHAPAMLDVVRVQDVGLSGKVDEVILDWAAAHGRVLLTHDVSTMKSHAWDRIARRLSMPGVFAVPQGTPIGLVIADILLIEECSEPGDWDGQVRYLPL